MLKPGDELKAQWTETITDCVTEGKVYRVVDIVNDGIGFRIINDKGEKCFPISTTFTKVGTHSK